MLETVVCLMAGNVEYKERFYTKLNKDMRAKKTAQTVIKGDEENASLYIVSRSFLMAMAEKYDVNPSKLLVGMQYGEMVVQVYDEGAYHVWQTLEIITMPNYG
jgi:E3 ubiquitin-protein ligase DOA10